MAPLRRLANTIGRDAKLSTRGTLIDGELRSAQGPGAAPPVWFVFTGVPTTLQTLLRTRLLDRLQHVASQWCDMGSSKAV